MNQVDRAVNAYIAYQRLQRRTLKAVETLRDQVKPLSEQGMIEYSRRVLEWVSKEDTAPECGHDEFSPGYCAEMSCTHYYGKRRAEYRRPW